MTPGNNYCLLCNLPGNLRRTTALPRSSRPLLVSCKPFLAPFRGFRLIVVLFHCNRHRHPPSGFGKVFLYLVMSCAPHPAIATGILPKIILTSPPAEDVSRLDGIATTSAFLYVIPGSFLGFHLFVILHLHLALTKCETLFHGFLC